MKNKTKVEESGTVALEFAVAFAASTLLIGSTLTIPQISTVETETVAAVLSDLQDISITEPIAGDTLIWNGEGWVNGVLNLGNLGSTAFANPQEGDVLMFNGANWYNSTPASPTVENLEGVDITSPAVGASLVWDGSEWSNGTSGIPGAVKLWGGSNTPAGWLVADGSAVSRSTYSALFAEIGLTYGAGNGSTTFNLPDFSGRAGMGLDSSQTEFNTLGETGGQKTVTLTETQMPSHTHTQNPHGHTGTADSGGTHGHTGTADSGGTHGHAVTSSISGAHTHTFNRRGTSQTRIRCCGSRSSDGTETRTSNSATFNHTHSYSLSSGGAHTHDVTVDTSESHAHDVTVSNSTAVNQTTGGGEAHDNLTPYVTVSYIIKY